MTKVQMTYEQDLKEVITRAQKDLYSFCNKGCDCYFFKGKKVGLKIYRNERIRNNSMFHQKLAHGFQLGPKVYEPIDIMIDNVHLYAYVTELCDVNDTYDWSIVEKGKFRNQMIALKDRAKELMINLFDYEPDGLDRHWVEDICSNTCNVGYLGEGEERRMVVVDFGLRCDKREYDDFVPDYSRMELGLTYSK